jgi:hypothetical protein
VKTLEGIWSRNLEVLPESECIRVFPAGLTGIDRTTGYIELDEQVPSYLFIKPPDRSMTWNELLTDRPCQPRIYVAVDQHGALVKVLKERDAISAVDADRPNAVKEGKRVRLMRPNDPMYRNRIRSGLTA